MEKQNQTQSKNINGIEIKKRKKEKRNIIKEKWYKESKEIKKKIEKQEREQNNQETEKKDWREGMRRERPCAKKIDRCSLHWENWLLWKT